MRRRLDLVLVERGLAPSRSQAQDLIKHGRVSIDQKVCTKPSAEVEANQVLTLAPGTPAYVSRGAVKLAAALDAFKFDPEGRVALDVGASTGGFTEVLLTRGAEKVYAVDVGHDQLHASLRNDPRVISLEGCDARTVTRQLLPPPVTAIVADVSFISLTKALGPALVLAAPGAWLVALIKPQFEVGRARVGKGGIVRDEAARQAAVEDVTAWFSAQPGWRISGIIASPIKGGSGNEEFLLGALRDG
ncbi:MAG: TlyA family RNA methyltransferase [Hyphomicrobiaceae bacterium]|nr:TlyA family RNA methyltransferase [Hyphomicrobiaceae bacterium]